MSAPKEKNNNNNRRTKDPISSHKQHLVLGVWMTAGVAAGGIKAGRFHVDTLQFRTINPLYLGNI